MDVNNKPLCDHIDCNAPAFKEVYLMFKSKRYKKEGWNYMCRKHFRKEKLKSMGKITCRTI